jgi:hypothetical protein
MDIIMEVITDLKTNLRKEEERSPSPPLSLVEVNQQSFSFFDPEPSPGRKHLLLKGIDKPESKIPRIENVVKLAQEKLQMMKNQLSEKLIEIKVVKEEQPETFGANQENMPKSTDEQGSQTFKLHGKNGAMLNMERTKKFHLIQQILMTTLVSVMKI